MFFLECVIFRKRCASNKAESVLCAHNLHLERGKILTPKYNRLLNNSHVQKKPLQYCNGLTTTTTYNSSIELLAYEYSLYYWQKY
jgi:hypothetical protein